MYRVSYIPFGYLADFLGFLDRKRDVIETLTYRALSWDEDWDCEEGYPREAAAWRRSLASGARDARKAYVLLQLDVDSVPERTMAALRVEEQLGLRSNVMIFNRRIDRRHYRDTSEVRYTDYIGDYAYLQSLEAKGFVIGYHCNAYERSGFSRPEAGRILLEDIEALSRHFRLEFMSAHGGPRDAEGKSNSSLRLPREARRRVRWIHNGYNVEFDGSFTDGGINSGRRAADAFDLRQFVQRMRPGSRYRILLHPQYYTDEVEANPHLRSPWYGEVLDAYSRSPRRNVWDAVQPVLGRRTPSPLRAARRYWRGWVRRLSGRRLDAG
jgi:hypothetical protein